MRADDPRVTSLSDILSRMKQHASTSLAIAEIAGRDSVAAVVAAVHARHFTRILPTVGFTGTETGDHAAPLRAIERMKALLGTKVEVLEPLELRNETLWSALNREFADDIASRFGVWSPCLACHLYFHLLRVPVSWEHNGAPVIAGERDTHDGRIKLSQTTESINAAIRVLASGDVDLLQPIRNASGSEVASLVGADWDEGEAQLGCELSGNYTEPDGTVRYNEDGYARYLGEFFEPVGRSIIAALSAGDERDYAKIVKLTLDSKSPKGLPRFVI